MMKLGVSIDQEKELFIPRLFHFIWLGPNRLDFSYIETWRRHHPDWQLRIWTDADLTKKNFDSFSQIQQSLKYTQKSDLMRYEILYRYGGVYFDVDFECKKNITELLRGHTFVVCNGDFDCPFPPVMANSFFAATPRHHILQYAMKEIQKLVIDNKKRPQEVTGPHFLGRVLDAFPLDYHELPPRLLFPHTYQEHFHHVDVSSHLKTCYGIHHWHNGNSGQETLSILPRFILFTNEFPPQIYGGVGISVYHMCMSLSFHYKVFLIFQPYHSNQFDLYCIEEGREEKIDTSNNIRILLKKISGTRRDVFINHALLQSKITQLFLDHSRKVYTCVHSFADLAILCKTLALCPLPNQTHIEDYYRRYSSAIAKCNKLITFNPLLTQKLSLQYPDKTIVYLPNVTHIYHPMTTHQISNEPQIKFRDQCIPFSRDAMHQLLQQLGKRKNFIYFGRIEYFKNCHTLLSVFTEFTDCTLTLIGTNYLKYENKNDSNIILVDELDYRELMGAISLFDMYISLSLSENFPNAVLDAGKHKIPCCLSKLPGFDMIFHDTVFYIEDFWSINLVKKEILTLLSYDTVRYHEKGEQLYELISRQYNVDHFHQNLHVLQY